MFWLAYKPTYGQGATSFDQYTLQCSSSRREVQALWSTLPASTDWKSHRRCDAYWWYADVMVSPSRRWGYTEQNWWSGKTWVTTCLLFLKPFLSPCLHYWFFLPVNLGSKTITCARKSWIQKYLPSKHGILINIWISKNHIRASKVPRHSSLAAGAVGSKTAQLGPKLGQAGPPQCDTLKTCWFAAIPEVSWLW